MKDPQIPCLIALPFSATLKMESSYTKRYFKGNQLTDVSIKLSSRNVDRANELHVSTATLASIKFSPDFAMSTLRSPSLGSQQKCFTAQLTIPFKKRRYTLPLHETEQVNIVGWCCSLQK